MVEACPVCDTLWRLYTRAAENLHELTGKHRDARDKGDCNGVQILAHEIAIAESALPVVRREVRRHETTFHLDRQENGKAKGGEAAPNHKS